MPKIFAAAFLMIAMTACGPSTTQATATESELCRSWGESLPTRSRTDTPQTRTEIQVAYADFSNACPAFAHLIP